MLLELYSCTNCLTLDVSVAAGDFLSFPPTNKTAPKATTTTAPEAIQIFVLIDIHPLLFDSIIFITPIVHICFLLYHYYYFTKPLSMMLKMHKKRPLLVIHREEALNLDILFKLADYLQDH
ncbi:hypothetical protein D3C78_1377300 [compost metagenome]